jgi:hypothetical protein
MISFIVPAYNEEHNIASTVRTIKATAREAGVTRLEIVVVDDGSTDGTSAALREIMPEHPELRVVTHPENQGLGVAIRTGMATIRGRQFMTVPGDNDLSRDFILMLLKFRDAAELVMSFPINSENRSLWRNLLSYLFRILYMVAFRIHVNYINGPCIYSADLVRPLRLRSQRFSIVAELNTKLLRTGCTFCEVPGYFQTGTRPRRMLSWQNLREVMATYLRLIYEVHLAERQKFGHTPRRIFIDLTGGAPVPVSAAVQSPSLATGDSPRAIG